MPRIFHDHYISGFYGKFLRRVILQHVCIESLTAK